MNEQNKRGWIIDDHDLTVEFYFRSLADMTKLSADPEWLAIQLEEEPYVNRERTVVSLGWVEKYVDGGKVVNFDENGETKYAAYPEVSDIRTAMQ